MIGSVLCTILAATLATAPIKLCGRLDEVIRELIAADRLPANSRCEAPLRNLPVALALLPNANAEGTLCSLVEAEWRDIGGVRTLTRSREVRRRIEQDQTRYLEIKATKVVGKWEKFQREVDADPASFGHRIQVQLEEYARTSGRSGASLSMPIDLIRRACGVDFGAARIARMKLDESLYFSNVTDGVHLPLGPRCAVAIETYQKALDEPSVREALRIARQVVSKDQLESIDLRGVRIIVWMARDRRGIVTIVWLYSAKGDLLDSGGSLDELAESSGSDKDMPVSVLPPGATVTPGAVSLLLARRVAQQQVPDPEGALRKLLLAGRSWSILDPFAEDVRDAIAHSFPGKSVGMLLDEAWFRQWAPFFLMRSPSLPNILSACKGGSGLQITSNNTTIVVKPALLLDSQAMIADPEAVQRSLRGLLSEDGQRLDHMCDLANALDTFSAFQFGIFGSYYRLALDEGAKPLADGSRVDYYTLKVLASLGVLPTMAQPVKSVRGTSVTLARIVRQAIGSIFMERAPETPLAPAITQRVSLASDDDASRIRWEVRLVPQVFFTFAGPSAKTVPAFSQTEIAETLSHYRRNSPENALADVQLLRGTGEQYEVRAYVAREAVWTTRMGQRVRWDVKAARLADLPEGPAIISAATKMQPPPAQSGS